MRGMVFREGNCKAVLSREQDFEVGPIEHEDDISRYRMPRGSPIQLPTRDPEQDISVYGDALFAFDDLIGWLERNPYEDPRQREEPSDWHVDNYTASVELRLKHAGEMVHQVVRDNHDIPNSYVWRLFWEIAAVPQSFYADDHGYDHNGQIEMLRVMRGARRDLASHIDRWLLPADSTSGGLTVAKGEGETIEFLMPDCGVEYDVFICHASEDKGSIVRDLEAALTAIGARVWLDEVKLVWGDSLSSSIDSGLSRSRYGLVVLSPAFFKKQWTQRELQGLVQRQMGERRTVILPLYHNISVDDVRQFSPPLADAFALESTMGVAAIAERFKAMLVDPPSADISDSLPPAPNAVSMLERAKSLIQGGQQIPLEDFLKRETDSAIDAISTPSFDLNADSGSDESFFIEFKRRITAYEAALSGLNAIQMVVAYYGGSEHHVALRRSLEKLGDLPHDTGKSSSGGTKLWKLLQRYPAVLSYHRSAAAAIASEHWHNLQPLIKADIAAGPLEYVRAPMLLQMRPYLPFEGSIPWLSQTDFAKPVNSSYTPADDLLADKVAEALGWFGVDQHEADRIFDRWLFLAQIAFNEIPETQGRWDPVFSYGRWWRILAQFRGWDQSPQGRLVAAVRTDGDASPILGSGIAEQKAARFLYLAAEAEKLIMEVVRKRG